MMYSQFGDGIFRREKQRSETSDKVTVNQPTFFPKEELKWNFEWQQKYFTFQQPSSWGVVV